MNRIPESRYYPGTGVPPELNCPNCGEYGYLHHGEVTVYARQEDATKGLRVSITGQTVEIDTTLEGNPSLRRGGMRVAFSCEICSGLFTLSLSQHKGQTELYWSEGEGHGSP